MRKSKKNFKMFFGVCLLLTVLSPLIMPKSEIVAKEIVIFGVTSSQSGMYPWQAAHGTLVNKNCPDIQVQIVECPNAAAEVLEHIRRGEMHFGIGGADLTQRAYHGVGEYAGRAIPELRFFLTLAVVPYTIFVSKESGINSINELTGKKFGTSFPGSATGMQIHKLCDGLGIKPNYFEATMGATMQAFEMGKIVGFIKPGAPDSSVLNCAAVKPIKLLSVNKEQFDICKPKYPGYFTRLSVIPAKTYPGQDEDVTTVTFLPVWNGTKKMSEDTVYKMMKVWYKDRKSLASLYAAANKEDGELGFPKLTMETATIPLHVGAYKFYKELGLEIPTSLIPPEAKK